MNYKKYKPSGVEWIGEIPEEWDFLKLKYALETLESGSRETGGGSIAEGVFSIGGEHIGWLGELLLDNPKYVSEDYYYNLRNGKIRHDDVLLVKDGATIGKCAIIKEMPFSKCAVNEHVFILRVNQNYSSKYLFYFVWCRIGQEQILLNIRGSAQPGLNSQFINEVIIPAPPKPEQTAIANYLDDKTAKIDKLIEKKTKLIELYKEERTAVINHYVLGQHLIDNGQLTIDNSQLSIMNYQLPPHWEVKKLKYVAKLRDELIDDSDFKIAVENIESGTGKLVGMEEDKNYQGKLSAFRNGDTIFNKLRPYLHKVYYAEQNGGLFGELLIIYSLGELLPKFLFYKLFSKIFIDIVDGSTQGTKMPRANWNDFISLLAISFPKDKEEQLQIVQHIETETKRIDEKIARAEKEIELLQEYRTVLISEVVTGKICVLNNHVNQNNQENHG